MGMLTRTAIGIINKTTRNGTEKTKKDKGSKKGEENRINRYKCAK
jgi:hypothetical protein